MKEWKVGDRVQCGTALGTVIGESVSDPAFLVIEWTNGELNHLLAALARPVPRTIEDVVQDAVALCEGDPGCEHGACPNNGFGQPGRCASCRAAALAAIIEAAILADREERR